jgi:hypothetical protein
MAQSTGPVLAMVGVTLFNDIVVRGFDAQQEMRVVVAGGVVALGLGLLERASPNTAMGLAWLGLITVLLVRPAPGKDAPLESIANWYNKK